MERYLNELSRDISGAGLLCVEIFLHKILMILEGTGVSCKCEFSAVLLNTQR